MSQKRRDFLKGLVAVPAVAMLPPLDAPCGDGEVTISPVTCCCDDPPPSHSVVYSAEPRLIHGAGYMLPGYFVTIKGTGRFAIDHAAFNGCRQVASWCGWLLSTPPGEAGSLPGGNDDPRALVTMLVPAGADIPFMDILVPVYDEPKTTEGSLVFLSGVFGTPCPGGRG